MTKGEALYQYFNKFMPAYRVGSVPEDAALPRLTYQYVTGGLSDQPTGITVNLWFRTTSEALPDAKAEELRQYILDNDLVVFDDGAVYVTPGEPWCNDYTDPLETNLKRRYINISLSHFNR